MNNNMEAYWAKQFTPWICGIFKPSASHDIWNGKSPRITQNVRNSPQKKLVLDVLKKTMRPVSARWWETLREQWGKWDREDRESSGRCEKVLEHLRELGSGSQRGREKQGSSQYAWTFSGQNSQSSSAWVRWFQKRDCHPRIKQEPGWKPADIPHPGPKKLPLCSLSL